MDPRVMTASILVCAVCSLVVGLYLLTGAARYFLFRASAPRTETLTTTEPEVDTSMAVRGVVSESSDPSESMPLALPLAKCIKCECVRSWVYCPACGSKQPEVMKLRSMTTSQIGEKQWHHVYEFELAEGTQS